MVVVSYNVTFNMLIVASDGTIKSVVPNSVVSKEMLSEVSNWIAEKCSM